MKTKEFIEMERRQRKLTEYFNDCLIRMQTMIIKLVFITMGILVGLVIWVAIK